MIYFPFYIYMFMYKKNIKELHPPKVRFIKLLIKNTQQQQNNFKYVAFYIFHLSEGKVLIS